MAKVNSPARVLVVDDDTFILRLCDQALRAEGYEVVALQDGAAAVERTTEGFDAIVSDIQMPGLDGLQLLRRVRERDLDVPILLITADPSLDTAERCHVGG